MVRIFSAGGLEDRNPFQTWRGVLADAFVPLDCEKVDRGPFAGRVDQVDLGGMSISRLRAGAHQVRCGSLRSENAASERVFLNLQMSGRGRTVTGSTNVVTRRFDLALADPAKEYTIRNEMNFDLVSFTIRRDKVPALVLERAQLPLSASPETQTFARLLCDYADLALQGIDRTQSDFVEIAVSQILELAVQRLSGASLTSPEHPSRAELIADYIRSNAHDGALSLGRVAHVFGITPRYVKKILSLKGDCFGDILMEARLESARSAILAADRLSVRITQIALESGFSDLSHFSRSYRRRYGESPSETRRRLDVGKSSL